MCAMFNSPLLTSWGMRSGDQGGGVESAMVVLWIFFVGCNLFLCQSLAGRREKISSDIKIVNVPWSL